MCLAKLFGKKKQETPVNFKLKMSDATFEFMTSSEAPAMKEQLKNKMIEYEKKGIYVYDINSEKWAYHIDNGQFRAAPIAPKM